MIFDGSTHKIPSGRVPGNDYFNRDVYTEARNESVFNMMLTMRKANEDLGLYPRTRLLYAQLAKEIDISAARIKRIIILMGKCEALHPSKGNSFFSRKDLVQTRKITDRAERVGVDYRTCVW